MVVDDRIGGSRTGTPITHRRTRTSYKVYTRAHARARFWHLYGHIDSLVGRLSNQGLRSGGHID